MQDENRHLYILDKCLTSLLKHNKIQKEALNIIESKPIPLDSSLYLPILQLCIDRKAEKEGRLVHDHLLRNGFDSDLYLNTKLIIFYAKIGDMVAARRLFDKMPERSIVSWTAMVSGYSQNGYLVEALEVFLVMRRSGFKANQFTYGSVLRACTNLLCLEIGKQIQACIVKSRFFENLFVQSALVDFHSKCGRMEDARYLFVRMSVRDVVSWNSTIGGYAVHGLAWMDQREFGFYVVEFRLLSFPPWLLPAEAIYIRRCSNPSHNDLEMGKMESTGLDTKDFGGMSNSRRDGNLNGNLSKTTTAHLRRIDEGGVAGGGNNGLTRVFSSLRAFSHRDIFNITSLDHCMDSSFPYKQHSQNQKTWQDPYLNPNVGTMSPFEHGEVFLLDDGGKVDLLFVARHVLWNGWHGKNNKDNTLMGSMHCE
ncbi:hypothetical protein HHK36_020066 [Tetracentron sinense]|uniref:CTP synthase N-terminal domain-containing protein n=1 Tax=Tetracentron sinense TaxID=13715 RepID=A0A835D816_TETSI|nr:hypothetical protein HHK36_020066 [Tetracentron sinense]